MTLRTIGLLTRTTRSVAYGGAVAIGLASAALGITVQAPSAHAAVFQFTVPAVDGPSNTFGGAQSPLNTLLPVRAATVAITFSADPTTSININNTIPAALAANGQTSSGTGSFPYTDPTPGSTALPGGHFGQLLYRIGAGGTIQAVPFTTGSLGPVTVSLPAGHGTGIILLFVNDNYYADNLRSFGVNVTTQTVDHLAILCGNSQVTPATAQYALPLVVQAQDALNNAITTPVNLTFTINPAGSNGAGASFTPVGTVPPFSSPMLTKNVATGPSILPAGCSLPGTQQGVAVVPAYANQFPSLPSSTTPPLEQYTIVVTAPTGFIVNPVTFSEASGQQVVTICSMRIGFFSSLGSANGTNSSQFALATGRLLGGRRTLFNYLSLQGSGGRLLAAPVTSSVTCLLPYVFTGSPAVRLPLQVDFDATVATSTIPAIARLSTLHVRIKQDLGASPPVESVTITDATQTTTYDAFDPSNTSVAPRTFVISAQASAL